MTGSFQVQTGLLKQATAPNGTTTKYEYDPFGRLFATYDAGADAASTGDDFVGFGNTTVYDGDPVERYRYWDTDWNYNGVTFLDPSGVEHQGVPTPFLISIEKRPGSYARPANSSSTNVSYDDQMFYDGFGRPIQTRSLWNWVEGQSLSREIISHTTYGANGQVNCQSIPYDVPFYDDQPKTWPTSPFYTLDTCASEPHTTTTHDALGRPLTITAPDGSTTNYSYYILTTLTADGRNRLALTNIEDANDHLIGQVTNSLGQLALVQENSGIGTVGDPYAAESRTWYYYDILGNLDTVLTSNGTITSDPSSGQILSQSSMMYDSLGRKVSMNDADMGEWVYRYDAVGNLTSQTDANGDTVCFPYDALNRMTYKREETSNTSGPCTTFNILARYIYNNSGSGTGQLLEVRWSSNPSQNKETFIYDSLGRLTTHNRWVDSRQYTMSYSEFDAFHRPHTHTLTYPNSNTEAVTLTYDHEGENKLEVGTTTLITAVTYNARGQLRKITRNDGPSTTFTYFTATDSSGGGAGDSNFRLDTITHGATNDAYPDYDYTYDLVGNIQSLEADTNTTTDTQTFGYDYLNRLTTAVGTGGISNYDHYYTYNALGNMISYDGANYSYSSSHKHAVVSSPGFTYTYDANGNMTLRNATIGNDYTQNFNVENELESVVVGSNTTSFTYDAAGIRVKTVEPDGKTIYSPFPGYEEEVDGSTTTRRTTYHLAGQAAALRVQVVGGSSTFYYLFTDHLGNTTALYNMATKAKVAGSDAYYYPFGDWRIEPTTNLTDRGFTGHLHNNLGSGSEDIGLIYMNARWYLPGLGRFISADTIIPNPANPQSFNRYSYTRNNPINFSDPSGHKEEDCIINSCQVSPAPTPKTLVEFDGVEGEEWTIAEKNAVRTGAWDLAQALYEASGGRFSSPYEAFMSIYGGSVTFYKTGTDGCPDKVCYGEWVGNNQINVYTDIYVKDAQGMLTNESKIPEEWAGPKWAIHELGHGFEAKVNTALGTNYIRDNLPEDVANRNGFAGVYPGWQQSPCAIDCNGEIFADMIIGWTYGQWSTEASQKVFAEDKANFMSTNMSMWINVVSP